MSDQRLNELIKEFQEGGAKEGKVAEVDPSDKQLSRIMRIMGKEKTPKQAQRHAEKVAKLEARAASGEKSKAVRQHNFAKNRLSKEELLAAKRVAQQARRDAFDKAVAAGVVKATEVTQWGGPNASIGPDGKAVGGFGRRFISQAGATRAFNRHIKNNYKTHGTRAAVRQRDMCTKAQAKNLRRTSSYAKNPIHFDYKGVDDGSRCKKEYGRDAKSQSKRSTAWTRYVQKHSGKGTTLAGLSERYNAEKARE